MKKLLLFLLADFLFFTASSQVSEIPYTVPEVPWEESFGNHRAVIVIDQPTDAVHIKFLWRRHDLSPEKNRMLIIHAGTGDTLKNVYRVRLDDEQCDLVAGPVLHPGTYYFYYLPYTPEKRTPFAGKYLLLEMAPDELWVQKHHLTDKKGRFKGVGKAEIKEIQSRSSFDSFYPMEVAATRGEVEEYKKNFKDGYLVFPEDRSYPIRMKDALPFRWIAGEPAGEFHGTAQRNEYYVLQIGIFASQKSIINIKLGYSDLHDGQGNSIPAEALTCFNTNGTDSWGRAFTRVVNVDQGKIQAMWVGIEIPGEVVPGTYKGHIDIIPENSEEKRVKIQLVVSDQYLADRGDGEPWRHSRLRWLNSTLGLDDIPVHPYTPLEVAGRKISCLGRSIQLNDLGVPEQINSQGNALLSTPVNFVIESENHRVIFPRADFVFKEKKEGRVNPGKYDGKRDVEGRLPGRNGIRRKDWISIHSDIEKKYQHPGYPHRTSR